MKLKSIDELTNRQLDSIIATQIVGEKSWIAIQDGELIPILENGKSVPAYSTHFDAAWELVKLMVAENKSVAIDYMASEKQWRCIIQNIIGRPQRAIDASLELAICRAVLMQAHILQEEL